MEINLKINFPSNINPQKSNQIPKTLKITYYIDFNNNENNDNKSSNLSNNIILNLQNNDNNEQEINQEKDNEDNKNILKDRKDDKKETNNNNDVNNNPINNIKYNQNNEEENKKNDLLNDDNKDNKTDENKELGELNDNTSKNEVNQKNNITPISIGNSLNSNFQSKRSNDNRLNNFNHRGRGRGIWRGKNQENINNNFSSIQNSNIMIPNDAKDELFVTGIREWMSENDVKETFSKYGEVESVKNLKDRITGINKGVGFIKFKEKKSAFFAMMDAENIICKGKHLKIRYNNKVKENQTKINTTNNEKKDEENIIDKNFHSKDSLDKKDDKKGNEDEDNVSHYSNYRERSRDKNINKFFDDGW